MISIAVVDDDAAIRELVRDVLTDEGYTPSLFDGTDGTHDGICAVSPAAIILDLHLGEPDAEWAWALLDRIGTAANRHTHQPVLIGTTVMMVAPSSR